AARQANGASTFYTVDPDSSLVLAESQSAGALISYYVYGLGLVSKVTAAGQVYYHHYDRTGSTNAVTDSAGAVVNRYSYGPYGELLSSSESIPNPFQSLGQGGAISERS